jgi:pSer/pThr/pTyr-binding forkhead associated (FHA) protein
MLNTTPNNSPSQRPQTVKLTILTGSRPGAKIRFVEAVTIGRRAAENIICIPDESVSSRHGQIEWVGDRVMLRDLVGRHEWAEIKPENKRMF